MGGQVGDDLMLEAGVDVGCDVHEVGLHLVLGGEVLVEFRPRSEYAKFIQAWADEVHDFAERAGGASGDDELVKVVRVFAATVCHGLFGLDALQARRGSISSRVKLRGVSTSASTSARGGDASEEDEEQKKHC